MKSASPEGRERIAKEAETSVAYLYQIAGGHSRPSPEMAKAIDIATSGVVPRMELLYPEETGEAVKV